MSVTVRGIYHKGTVVLLDPPRELREGPVEVTLSEDASPEPAWITYGKYRDGKLSTEDDFRMAEWRGEDDGP